MSSNLNLGVVPDRSAAGGASAKETGVSTEFTASAEPLETGSAGNRSTKSERELARQNQYISELREQDRWLPINNVSRLMKNTLPLTAKVSKDAKECMQECVSEFISFVTSEASDRCSADKRKTINGEDILISLHALGFENYAEVLKIYLAKYRQQQALKNQMMYEQEEAQGLPGEVDDDDDEEDEEDISQQYVSNKHQIQEQYMDEAERKSDEERPLDE